jgi:hypothetical protein
MHDEDFRKMPAFIPSLDLKDDDEWRLADWVLQVRTKRLWSLDKQIEMLRKWNAHLDRAVAKDE